MFGFGLSLPKQNALFGGASFNPLTIASMSEWFDYRVLTTVGDGNPISSWAGRKGLYTLTQSGTARPTYVANDGDGRAAAQFDGVNDHMDVSVNFGSLFGPSGDCEIWSVVKLSFAGSLSGLFDCYGSTNTLFAQAKSTPEVGLCIFDSSTEIASATNVMTNVWKVLRFVKIGARRIIQVNGMTVYDASTSSGVYDQSDTGNLRIGERLSLFFMLGSYRHWMSFNAPMDDATAAKLTDYLTSA